MNSQTFDHVLRVRKIDTQEQCNNIIDRITKYNLKYIVISKVVDSFTFQPKLIVAVSSEFGNMVEHYLFPIEFLLNSPITAKCWFEN